MRTISAFRYPEWPMKRKLFGYMLLLAALLVLALVSGLFLFGRFDSTEKSTYESLDIQIEIFEKDVSSHLDGLAASGIRFSQDISLMLENYLALKNISFSDLNGSADRIGEIQESLIDPLRQKLLQEDCSGAFVLLNTTVNDTLANANLSKAGLYLQINGYASSNPSILLFRGPSELGKRYDMMPHRKWRLEFRSDVFPDYERITALAALPLDEAYYFTELSALPGTSDKAMLLTVPIVGKDGQFYGICGFEISESYFMTYHAQSTRISHLTCLLAPKTDGTLDASNGLSCGVSNGYHRAPRGILSTKDLTNDLICFTGGDVSYIGVTRKLSLSPNNDNFALSVMMLKSDHDREVRKSILQNLILLALLLFFTVNCCLFFSRRFLSPILKGLEQLKSDDLASKQVNIPEIDDLFLFLAEKDREHEETLSLLTQEKKDAQAEKELLLSEYQKVQSEVSRLAYSRMQEVNPDDYARFMEGIDTLTPAERKIFNYYLSGKSVKEIISVAAIKESTIRYHNQNIYSKLGVTSLKQLLLYAAIMRQQETERSEMIC